jgi:hypothetical protein
MKLPCGLAFEFPAVSSGRRSSHMSAQGNALGIETHLKVRANGQALTDAGLGLDLRPAIDWTYLSWGDAPG